MKGIISICNSKRYCWRKRIQKI